MRIKSKVLQLDVVNVSVSTLYLSPALFHHWSYLYGFHFLIGSIANLNCNANFLVKCICIFLLLPFLYFIWIYRDNFCWQLLITILLHATSWVMKVISSLSLDWWLSHQLYSDYCAVGANIYTIVAYQISGISSILSNDCLCQRCPHTW